MTARQCMPCTVCCHGWLKAKKPFLQPGHGCKHCTAAGCGIYETRPVSPCRVFKCGWLIEDSPLPDEMRPDQCGAIVLLDRKWRGHKIIAALPTGPRIPEETLEWLKKYAVEQGTPLVYREHFFEDGEYKYSRKMGFGPPAFVQAVQAGLMREDVIMF